jgi:hypothetical protein
MHPVPRFLVRAPLLAVMSCFSGCQSGEQLILDAASRPTRETIESYSLVVKDPAIEIDSLRHQEAERLVKAALAGHGYYESPNPARYDMAITIDYGIDPGRSESVMVSHPIYRSEARSHTESEQIGVDANGREIYRTITVREPPEMVYAGEEERLVRQTVYDKRLVLQARKARSTSPGDAPEDLWVIEVISTGPEHDLRKTLPVLAAVALEHLGENTDGPRLIKLSDSDAVAFVKNAANVP